MEIFDGPYYSINKFLLKLYGLWPYLTSTRKNVSLLCFTIFMFSLMIPIMAGCARAWGKNTIMVAEDIIGLLYFTGIYIKYILAYFYEDRMKLVYIQMAKDWQKLSDSKELKILDKYAREGRQLSIIYVSYGLFAITIFINITFTPLFMDTLFPRNGSRGLVFPYYANYFIIDEIEYHYTLFACHGMFICFFSTMCATAIDTMFVANVKHACGLFAIVCYRLQNIGKVEKKYENQEIDEFLSDAQVYRDMSSIFIYHQKSIETVQMINQSFSFSFLVVMSLALVGVALLMFDILLHIYYPVQILRIGIMLIGIYLSLFYLNWNAQQIVNSSDKVFICCYIGRWFNFSVKARKLVSVIMARSVKPCVLSAGGLFDMNLQSFAAIVRTSASYATVMLSMQQPA